MRLSPLARLAVGVVTVGLFGLAGAVLYGDGRTVLGGILIALSILRGVAWLRQAAAYRQGHSEDH